MCEFEASLSYIVNEFGASFNYIVTEFGASLGYMRQTNRIIHTLLFFSVVAGYV